MGDRVTVVGENTIHLGQIKPYGITNAVFRLRNNSDQSVRIDRLVSTCSCIRGNIPTNEIPPKGELTVTAALDAALVHGAFRRGVWVSFVDPKIQAVNLSLTGFASALFSGFPEAPLSLQVVKPDLPITNSFTFTALTTNATLGLPSSECSEGVTLAYTLSTNRTDKPVYTLTTVLTVREILSRQSAVLFFPVEGISAAIKPLTVSFKLSSAQPLVTVPKQISLDPKAAGEQNSRLIVRSRTESLSPQHLTWDPLPDGVTLTCATVGSRRRRSLAVGITVTPKAVASLLETGKETHSLRFHYPNHMVTTVSLVPLGTAAPATPNRVPFTQRFNVTDEDGENKTND